MIKCKDDEVSPQKEGFLQTIAFCLSLLIIIHNFPVGFLSFPSYAQYRENYRSDDIWCKTHVMLWIHCSDTEILNKGL